MSIKIFVSKDSAALSLGADQVAAAIAKEAQARKLDIQIVRNSSRGLFWRSVRFRFWGSALVLRRPNGV